MNKREKVLLIIPAYNEQKNILNVINNINSYNKKNNTNYDYIVINYGSTDDTESMLIKNKINHITLVHNLGIGGAVQTGYKYARFHNYDIAVQFDGDGQHDVNYVKDIIEPIKKKQADFVIGSRYIDKSVSKFKSTKIRRFGIKLISSIIKIVSKQRVYDTTSGFRACNRKIINEFALEYPLEYPEPVTTAELIKKGYKFKEIPVNMHKRESGVSSIKTWKNAYYMINVYLSIIMVGIRRYK